VAVTTGAAISEEGDSMWTAYLWKLPDPTIFFFASARKTLETTSNVGSS
jgi:hypothetical protein